MIELIQSWFNGIGITEWRDVIELLLLTVSVYALSLWLKKDATRPLLGIFYGYCLITLLCNALQLTTLSTLLIASAPILLCLALMVHHDALQKRMVMYRSRFNQKQTNSAPWPDTLFRSALIALNQNKDWFIIIEHQHDLSSLLQSSCELRAPLNESVLTVVTTSAVYQAGSLVWIKSDGTLHAINAQWQLTDQATWQDQSVKELPLWKQDALLMTLKTDAIICKAEANWRAFDVIIAGKIFEGINANQALALIKKHLHYHDSSTQGGIIYETTQPTSSYEQRTP